MTNLFSEFKKLIKGQRPQEELFVPLLVWSSGSDKNIELCQKINRQFSNGNRKVFISELTLHNNIKHIIRYPKVAKDDEKTKFLYDDICKYFNWTPRELQKNISTLNIDDIKHVIANAFGYENNQRKLIGIGGIQYGKQSKKQTKQSGLGKR